MRIIGALQTTMRVGLVVGAVSGGGPEMAKVDLRQLLQGRKLTQFGCMSTTNHLKLISSRPIGVFSPHGYESDVAGLDPWESG